MSQDREGQYRHSHKDLKEGRRRQKAAADPAGVVYGSMGLGPFGPADRYLIEVDANGKSLRLIEKAKLPNGHRCSKSIVMSRDAVRAPQPQVTAVLLLDNATGKEICSAHVISTIVDRPTGAIVPHKLELRIPTRS